MNFVSMEATRTGMAFPGSVLFGTARPFGNESIKTGRAFRGRPPGIIVEPGTHSSWTLPISLLGVEWGGQAGSIRMVARLSYLSAVFLPYFGDQRYESGDELQFEFADIQALMVKTGHHSFTWPYLSSCRNGDAFFSRNGGAFATYR
jgi:hypothetical protein